MRVYDEEGRFRIDSLRVDIDINSIAYIYRSSGTVKPTSKHDV
jgi:hypothetical protein